MNPEPITLKMIVDANIASLKGEGMKLGALHGHKECRYRYEDGCGCAIGVAIPEGHPFLSRISAKGSENLDLNALSINEGEMEEILPIETEHFNLIGKIQYYHDRVCHNNSPESEEEDRTSALSTYKHFLTKAFKEVYPGQPLPEVLTTP